MINGVHFWKLYHSWGYLRKYAAGKKVMKLMGVHKSRQRAENRIQIVFCQMSSGFCASWLFNDSQIIQENSDNRRNGHCQQHAEHGVDDFREA